MEQVTKRVVRHEHCVNCGGNNKEAGMKECPQCHHFTYCEGCNFCNLHKDVTPGKVKKEPTREFLVECAFTPKKGSYDYKGSKVVKAFSINGAIRKGTYELKKELVPARRQLKGVRVTCVPLTAKSVKKEKEVASVVS